jgi:imidazole glycerol phosphate synthase subunit HisF
METNQLTTTSILSLFETSKEQRNSFCSDIIENLVEGVTDPLKVHLQIKAMEEIIKTLTDSSEKTNKNFTMAMTYKNLLLTAAEKHGKKFQLHNAEFSIKEVGTVYDWSQCADTELSNLLIQQEQVKEKIRAKQDFLKTVPLAGLEILIGDELVKVFPPSKSSTTSVAVSLK